MSSTQKMQETFDKMWQTRKILHDNLLWITPDKESSLIYAVTEVGEVFDAYVRGIRAEDKRKNEGKEVLLEEELADTWIMLATSLGPDYKFRHPTEETAENEGNYRLLQYMPESPRSLGTQRFSTVQLLATLNRNVANSLHSHVYHHDFSFSVEVAMLIISYICPDIYDQIALKLQTITFRQVLRRSKQERIAIGVADGDVSVSVSKIWRTQEVV